MEFILENKKDYGIFFTPQWVIDYMIDLVEWVRFNEKKIKVLEPACANCQFLQSLKKLNKNLLLTGVEINEFFINFENDNMKIIFEDYLLWETKEKFNLIIGNPPYGIPSLSLHYTIRVDDETKAKYKKIYKTWYGKYNVYGAFIEKSINLLEENGQLIFIIPATFMLLNEFKKLRKFLSENGKTEIIYMGNDIFKPEVDVTNVILKFTKNKNEKNKLILYDFKDKKEIFLYEKVWNGEMILFETEFTKFVDNISSFKIKDLFSIKISPRTPEIRENPFIKKSENNPDDNRFLPILNGKNLKIGKVLYKSITKLWISKDKKNSLRKFFNRPHIVVGLGFRGDGQIGAAYDCKAYPWMGDVYHFIKENTIFDNCDLTNQEIVEYLNSSLLKKYVKDIFREITYHFSIAQLEILPLPKRKELEKIINEQKLA